MSVRTLTLVVAASAIVFVSACAQAPPPPPPPPKTVTVTMQDIGFSPAEVTARVGDTVEWVNKDVFDHTATARSGPWDVAVDTGKTGKVVLAATGPVEYYCKLHPNMVGKITVR